MPVFVVSEEGFSFLFFLRGFFVLKKSFLLGVSLLCIVPSIEAALTGYYVGGQVGINSERFKLHNRTSHKVSGDLTESVAANDVYSSLTAIEVMKVSVPWTSPIGQSNDIVCADFYKQRPQITIFGGW